MGKVVSFNYFPFSCDPPFLQEYFIFDSNISQAMKMYWRVRVWKVTCVLSDREVSTPSNGTYISYAYWDVDKEEDLVCPNIQFLTTSQPDWEEFGFALYANTNQRSLAAGVLFRPSGDSGEPEISSVASLSSKLGGTLSLENFGEGGTFNYYTPNATLPAYGNFSISIRAYLYWSYGNTYDVDTGKLL
jgi:hypothetical protein